MKTNGFSIAPSDLNGKEENSYGREFLLDETVNITHRTGVQVVLMSEKGVMQTLLLPEPAAGKHYFESCGEDLLREYFYIEAEDGCWYASCNDPAYFRNEKGDVCLVRELRNRSVLFLEGLKDKYTVYVEDVNDSSDVFRYYQVNKFSEIHIGRADENDIVYPNSLVSRDHAALIRNSKTWFIRDYSSRNGVFVNGKKAAETDLKVGDQIYIMGLRIIIGADMIAINDSNRRVRVQSEKIRRTDSTTIVKLSVPKKPVSDQLFDRTPRKKPATESKPVAVDLPPLSLNSIPLILRQTGGYGHNAMLNVVTFPAAVQKYTEKQRKDYEDKRILKYNQYLVQKNEEIKQKVLYDQRVLTENYPAMMDVLTFTENRTRLWERRVTDDDFMTLRVGSGSRLLRSHCTYPPRGLDLDEDPLVERMYQLVEKPVQMENVPVVESFLEDIVCGIKGRRKWKMDFVRQLIMQLSLLHGYDEVKIVLLAEEKNLKEIDFVRHLPHTYNDRQDFWFVAADPDDAGRINEYLRKEIGEDLEKRRDLKDILRVRPYYMVFALSKDLLGSMEVLKTVLRTDKNCGVSVLAAFDMLPKECTKIFELKDSGEHTVVDLKYPEREDVLFRLDPVDETIAKRSMQELSGIILREVAEANARQPNGDEQKKNLSGKPETQVQLEKEHAETTQSYEEFCASFAKERIPLGFHLEDMKKIAIPLQQLYSMSLYFGNPLCASPVMKNLLWAVRREQAELIVIKRGENSLFDGALLEQIDAWQKAMVLPCTHDGVKKLLEQLKERLQEREIYKDAYCREQAISDWNEPEDFKKGRKYMRSRCKPVFVVFESLLDAALQIDIMTAGALCAYFQSCLGYNIYFAACHYPDDDGRMHQAKYPFGEENASGDASSDECIRRKELRHIWDGIRQAYNREQFVLLFGGQYDKQDLAFLPGRWRNVKNPCSAKNIDKLLMHYHGSIYNLSMPCQKVVDIVDDTDEWDIIDYGEN